MFNAQDRLAADASFRERAIALGVSVTKDGVQPLDDLLQPLQRFATARRHEVRVARLKQAQRTSAAEWRLPAERMAEAIRGFSAGVKALATAANELRPLITPALDDAIALAADESHPLSRLLHEAAVSLGFSTAEVGWLFGELEAIAYRPVHIVCAGGFEDLLALLAAASAGEIGLTVAGFVRFTGDPALDRRLEGLVVRLRKAGVTASVFLALVIILTAHFAATLQSPRSAASS